MQNDHSSLLGDLLGPFTTEPAADVGDYYIPAIDEDWIIPQKTFAGENVPEGQASQSPEPMKVNILAQLARDSEFLAAYMSDPLAPGFTLDLGVSSEGEKMTREGKKFTVRLAFICGDDVRQNDRPKQFNEYAARHQSSEAARKALLRVPKRKTSKPIPLMRITLAELVAEQLLNFMKELADKRTPLTFRGRPVHYQDVMIVDLRRPTRATVQPTLMIARGSRDLYVG